MQEDFHYYATYCAAYLAGYSHEESMEICYSAQLVDLFSRTFLTRIRGPLSAATTQFQAELLSARTDKVGLQDITRIWSSFHFLPKDLYAEKPKATKTYLNKYRLICGPNGPLLADTVELAKGKGLEAAGLAMHVLADTWAHRYFAGTPSLSVNNTNYYFYEIIPDGEGYTERSVAFNHNPSSVDDIERGLYTNSLYQGSENSIMNLGHGRAGHLPDYSFARYRYLPAWGEYREIIKDNPSDYLHAFTQMIYALRYLRGEHEVFETGRYDAQEMGEWTDEVLEIISRRQLDASSDWKSLGESLSGCAAEDFDLEKYTGEYTQAEDAEKDDTVLGRYFLAALAQKSMVTNRIFTSGNNLAGESVDFRKQGFKGMRDFRRLIREAAQND